MNNQAFIDGQNLYVSTLTASPSWSVDYKKLRIFLKQRFNVTTAYYFLGTYVPENKDLYDSLEKDGYILVFREHSGESTSHKKGNVDTDIVFSIMKKLVEKEDFDKVILVSGDGDYWRMVDYLISKNKFERLMAPNRQRLSSLYKRKMADKYCFLMDDPDTKKKISYSKA